MKQLTIIISLLVSILSGCSLTDHSSSSNSSFSTASSTNHTNSSGTTISGLYQNAKEDAQIAISVKDFRLLTFKDTEASLPGVTDYFKISKLLARCGSRFLPGSGVLSESGFQNPQQKAMYQYAHHYNEIILKACRAHFTQTGPL